jgi:hypothetical protein
MRLEMGTETLSNSMKVDPEAPTPELCIWRVETPGILRGMMRSEMPAAPGPPVRTAAVQ